MKLTINRRSVLAAAAAVSMGLTSFAATAAETTLRLSHLSPPNSDMDV